MEGIFLGGGECCGSVSARIGSVVVRVVFQLARDGGVAPAPPTTAPRQADGERGPPCVVAAACGVAEANEMTERGCFVNSNTAIGCTTSHSIVSRLVNGTILRFLCPSTL